MYFFRRRNESCQAESHPPHWLQQTNIAMLGVERAEFQRHNLELFRVNHDKAKIVLLCEKKGVKEPISHIFILAPHCRHTIIFHFVRAILDSNEVCMELEHCVHQPIHSQGVITILLLKIYVKPAKNHTLSSSMPLPVSSPSGLNLLELVRRSSWKALYNVP